ncbi:MAG: sensor histidine kinase [Flavobacteriales bacterium]|nr:MAG: sensor histidine kinase [Flavobacteriales bacterium]
MFNLRLPAVVLSCSGCLFVMPLSADTNADRLANAPHDAVSTNQRATVQIAAAYRTMDKDPVAARELAKQAVLLADRSAEPVVEHKAMVCLASIEVHMGLFHEAMKTTLKAVELAQELGDPVVIAMDLRELSKVYRYNGMLEKAVEEARNSLAMLLPTRRENEVAEGQQLLIRALMEAGQWTEAQQLAEGCMAKAKLAKDTLKMARVHVVQGQVLVAQQRFSDAVVHLAQAERALGGPALVAERVDMYEALTLALIGHGRTQEAAEALRKVAAILEGKEAWSDRQRMLDLRYRLAVANQEWREAVVLLERIKSATDSMLTARMDMQMTSMQLDHQLARKEKANEELRTENARNAESMDIMLSQNNQLVAALLVASVLAVALFLSGRYNRRMAVRLKLKNAVVKRQHDQIHAKNLELQRQNLRLAEALMGDEEKETMIKEIHHRVKNNLQVVDSLLHIQGIEMADPLVGKVLRETQGRIRSMALVHDQIYRSQGLGNGDLRTHLEKLSRNILVAYGAHDRISVRVDTDLPLFRMNTLLPLTLVVNELLTNALKYAFQGQETGRIAIAVKATAGGYELRCQDDGVGMAPDHARERSFGLELVRVLAEQLNGSFRVSSGNGTTLHLDFAPDKEPMRIAS